MMILPSLPSDPSSTTKGATKKSDPSKPTAPMQFNAKSTTQNNDKTENDDSSTEMSSDDSNFLDLSKITTITINVIKKKRKVIIIKNVKIIMNYFSKNLLTVKWNKKP